MFRGFRTVSSTVLVVLMASGCRHHPSSTAPATSAGTSFADQPAPVFVEDALWKRARSLDPIDLAKLADREGALGLVAGVGAGGPARKVALAALPLASDADSGIGPLCAMLPKEPAAERMHLLDGLLVLLEAPAPGEALDAEGQRNCRAIVARLEAKSASPAEAVRLLRVQERLQNRLGMPAPAH